MSEHYTANFEMSDPDLSDSLPSLQNILPTIELKRLPTFKKKSTVITIFGSITLVAFSLSLIFMPPRSLNGSPNNSTDFYETFSLNDSDSEYEGYDYNDEYINSTSTQTTQRTSTTTTKVSFNV